MTTVDTTHNDVNIVNASTEAFTKVTLPAPSGKRCQEANIQVKVDTGAGGNVLPLYLFHQLYPEWVNSTGTPTGLQQTNIHLSAYNSTRIPQHRVLDTWTRWKPHDSKPCVLNSQWYVADTDGPAILGLPASKKLGVVMMNCAICFKKPLHTHSIALERQQITRDLAPLNPEKLPPIYSTADLRKEFPDHFEGTGKFPVKYHITVKPDAKPVIPAPQKCPIAMRSHICTELDCLECLGIIQKVDEPTDWVSTLAIAWKPNGKLHVCLDPRDLDRAIKCDHYRIPSVEEITHNFTGFTIFNKVDGTACYYCVKFNEESQLLTTFNSPEGCYSFQHLPPGLVCNQDNF